MTREELLMHARALYECSLTPENVKSAIEKEFPELKESEDARIIRFFTELATDACGGHGQEYYEELGLNYDKVMTWLESKKERQTVEWEWPNLSNCIRNCKKCHGKCFYRKEPYEEQKPIKVYDNMDDLIADAMIDEINESDMLDRDKHNRVYWITKHRQKPAEWSEEDKVMLNNIIWSVHMKSIIKPLYEMDDRSKYKKYEDFLKALPERFNLQPKQEWSEEDKLKLDNLVGLVEEIKRQPLKRLEDWDGYINWLKSLQERFNLQPKQEWGDEDEKMLASFLHKVEVCDLLTNKENVWIVKRLKALRPQPHTVEIKDATNFGNLEYERGVKDGIQSEKSRQWKPSKKQMKALEASCSVLKTHDTWGEDEHLPILMSLINDLQKLL